MWWTNSTFNHPNPSLTFSEGVCVQKYLGGDINLLQFEPSDLTIDEENGLLLVASLSQIIGIPDGMSTAEVDAKIVYRAQNQTFDFEAIEMIDGVLFAVSEGSKASDIVAFGKELDGHLVPTSMYHADTKNTEGMAYIPNENWLARPSLVLAGLTDGLNLRMDAYDYPLPNSTLENPVTLSPFRLNEKIFATTLLEQKVAAMQYFEGLLYLLFDNATVIRAFDSKGNLVQETNLPIAVEGFEKQWEGMEFQRKNGNLILHLALDSPPQVWSLLLEENQGGAGWKLPLCAT
jgi:hypothetical protein